MVCVAGTPCPHIIRDAESGMIHESKTQTNGTDANGDDMFKEEDCSEDGSDGTDCLADGTVKIEGFTALHEGQVANLPVYRRKRMNGETISWDEIRCAFHLPLSRASKEIGVCDTVLKQHCRKLGLKKWPHRQWRQIKSMTTKTEGVLARMEKETWPMPMKVATDLEIAERANTRDQQQKHLKRLRTAMHSLMSTGEYDMSFSKKRRKLSKPAPVIALPSVASNESAVDDRCGAALGGQPTLLGHMHHGNHGNTARDVVIVDVAQPKAKTNQHPNSTKAEGSGAAARNVNSVKPVVQQQQPRRENDREKATASTSDAEQFETGFRINQVMEQGTMDTSDVLSMDFSEVFDDALEARFCKSLEPLPCWGNGLLNKGGNGSRAGNRN